jgi:hypothetical protein
MLFPSAGVAQFESQAAAQATNGMSWWDSVQKGISAFLGGIQQQFNSTIFVATAGSAVANTTNETSLIGTGVGSKTLPASFFVAGKVIRIRGGGIYSSLGSSPGTITFKIKLGSTVIASQVLTPTVSMASSAFQFDLRLTCRSAGGSGTIMPEGRLELATYTGATGSGSRTKVDMNNLSAAVTVDTTISQVLDLTATWATASASNTITGATANVEVLN